VRRHNRDQARGLLKDGLDGAEVGQGIDVADAEIVGRHATGIRVGRLVDRRLGSVDHGSDGVPRVPISVAFLRRSVAESALEETLKDLTVAGVFIEQSHILGVEAIVLLENDIDEFLELLVVLRRHASKLDPLEVQLTASRHKRNQRSVER
jgi:hypothetical protein